MIKNIDNKSLFYIYLREFIQMMIKIMFKTMKKMRMIKKSKNSID